jgi:DNA-binding winged helix-turn-helix (wHTH) protein
VNRTVKYGSAAFEPELTWARIGGERVAFTRAERLLLRAFMDRAGRPLSRTQLLDAVAGVGATANDRTVDFTVNRLRRKLGDDAREPRFIATRYGEGYVWVAERAVADAGSSGAFIVVGPVHGLSDSLCAEPATAFGQGLAAALDRRTGRPQRVVFDPASPIAAAGFDEAPQFLVTLSFLRDAATGRVDCSIALRFVATGAVVKVLRLSTQADGSEYDDLATQIMDAAWLALNYGTEHAPSATDAPLAVRMHEASERLGMVQGQLQWQDAQTRLRGVLARDPDDAGSKVTLAMALHAKYLVAGMQILSVDDPRRADEAEIEALVTTALPAVEGNDIYVLAAAKLLDFVSPIYSGFALELAERAFAQTSALATAFTTLGQMRMHRGDIKEALRLFRLGSELAEPGSHFSHYLGVLICEAHLASGDLDALSRATEGFFAREEGRRFYALLMPPPAGIDVSYDLDLVLAHMTEAQARGMMLWLHYATARLFADRLHRQNIMRHLARLLIERMGAAIVPPEVAPDLPSDLLAV